MRGFKRFYGFKTIINWNKYQSKVTIQEPNPYLDYLIDPSFPGVNRFFVLPFENDYTTSCLLDYNYFNKYYKMIAIDLSKQQTVDADPKAIQQINFTGNLAREVNANTTLFFIIEEAKEPILYFLQGTLEVFQFVLF